MKNKYRFLKLIIAAIVFLSIPFIAMKFSKEINWSVKDFACAAIMLFILAVVIEFTLRIFRTTKQRLIALVFLAIVFIIIWIELAVGIFNSPWAGS